MKPPDATPAMRPPCVRRPRTRSTTSSPARSAPPDAPAERAVPDHLLCSICVEALEDPVLHPCGNAHCFCRECLECVAATAADAAAAAYPPRADRDRDRDPGDVDIACPLCRAPGAFSRVVPATAVAAQLAARAATCGACGEAVRLSAFKQHGRECASRGEAERRSRASARERWRRYVRGALERSSERSSASGRGVALTVNRRSSRTYVNRETFACPLCVAAGVAETDDHPGCHLDPIALLRHLETYHHDDDDSREDDDDDASSIGEAGEGGRVARVRRARPFAAVCPVCVSMPWGDPTRVCRDLEAHIRLRHRFDVARFADVEADEEEAVRMAMRRSAAEAGVADAGDAGDAGYVVPAGSEVVHTESEETSSSAEEDDDDADVA